MKWLIALLLVAGLAWAATHVPPRTAARVAARGLRAGWDWVESIRPDQPRRPPAQKQASRKAQAAAPQRRTTRDGIVPQPPKEMLRKDDRAALDSLVENSR